MSIEVLGAVVFALVASGSSELADPRTGGAETLPNIVLINADDLGYGDLGCYGATKVRTPHLDQLAAEGRRFTDAHTASAVCSPSRYGLITGRYPLRRNLWGPVGWQEPLRVDPQRMTIARVLQEAGYRTACIGKWHLGFGTRKPEWNLELKPGPLELGFDHYFGLPVVNSSPPYVYVEGRTVVGYDPEDPFVLGRKSVTEEFPEKGGYKAVGGAQRAHEIYRDRGVATRFRAEAIDWLSAAAKSANDQPFFLYLATTNIHHPFTPAPQFQGTSDCGRYGDFIHELDWLVGGVLAALEEFGVAEDTLVIFTSDNGGMLNHGGQDAWKAGHRLNGDLLGFKFGAWEGGHRVPFIARWPGRIPAGSVSDALLGQVDLLATFAALVGRDLSQEETADSLNQLPNFIEAEPQPVRQQLMISPNRPSHLALREGRWMYIGAQGEGGFGQKKVGDHCFGGAPVLAFTGQVNSDVAEGAVRADAPAAQLYDLEADPRQSRNVIEDHPEIAARMAAVLAGYRQRIPAGKPLGWIDRR